jgi:ParB/RepB/Spo0J family partition protein
MSEEKGNVAGNAATNTVGTDLAAQTIGPDKLLYLLPEEITIPESGMDVRPWTSQAGATDKETEAIGKLAETIAAEGQIMPVKCRYGKGGEIILIDGRRRVQSVALINAGKSNKETPLRVKVIIGTDEIKGARAYRQSMIANIHRLDLSPMDIAQDIKNIREQFKWTGADGTKKVAEYLKVSPATITQHEKLLTLTAEVQAQIHDGTLSRDAAFAVSKVEPSKQAAVVEKAKETQKEEKAASKAKPPADKPATGNKQPTKAAARETGTVKARHIRKAAREIDPTKPQPRSKKEIVEFFAEKEGAAYGHANGAVQTFIREFCAWVLGGSSDRKLDKLFDVMVEKADKGTLVKKADAKKTTKAADKGKK